MNFFIIIFLIILLDIVTIKGLKKTYPQFCSLHRRLVRNAFVIQTTLSVIIVLCGFFFQRRVSDYQIIALYSYFFGFVSALYFSKSLYVMFLFADGILAAISRWYRRLFDKFPRGSHHIVAKGGLWMSMAFVCLILSGILFGRYHYTVNHVEIEFANLPRAFNEYKIVQISDIHAGSFAGSAKRFQKVIDMINKEEPNLIVFTGDMVNNFAGETTALIPIFSQLYARDGKFAVLGNHDYGGYSDWDTPADSVANHEAIKNAIEQMGFVLLNNQSVIINHYNTDRIALIGVENYGSVNRHPKRGNLEKAIESVSDIPFKVLLMHNPLFWPVKVRGKTDIALTLAGHTHGMQVGIKFGIQRFIPARFRYRYGAGLFQTGRQYLYVNRGLGVIGFPGRIGMWPEITVIHLLK